MEATFPICSLIDFLQEFQENYGRGGAGQRFPGSKAFADTAAKEGFGFFFPTA